MSKAMILKPRMSEKSYALSESLTTYVFDVPARANRFDVMKAVAEQYSVGVASVRIAKTAAKTKRSYRRGGRRSQMGEKSAVRKAYITLKAGDKLPVFASVEEAQKPAKEAK